MDIDAVKGGEERYWPLWNIGGRGNAFWCSTPSPGQMSFICRQTLAPRYPRCSGWLSGHRNGLAEYLWPGAAHLPVRDIRSLCFCASAYDIAHKQITYSAERGLPTVPLDIDAYIEGGKSAQRAAKQAEQFCRGASSSSAGGKYSLQARHQQSYHGVLCTGCNSVDHDAAFDGWSSSAARACRACSGSSALSICEPAAHTGTRRTGPDAGRLLRRSGVRPQGRQHGP
ncbi:MAG: hypothetical protein ACLUIR_04325 [Faecalibacterium prausnitzii]